MPDHLPGGIQALQTRIAREIVGHEICVALEIPTAVGCEAVHEDESGLVLTNRGHFEKVGVVPISRIEQIFNVGAVRKK